MTNPKKKIIKSLETISDELRDMINRQYPVGYENSITRIKNAKNEPIFVFPLETEDTTYLIKVPFVKNSEGDYAVEKTEEEEFSANPKDLGADSDDDFDNDDDYDGSGGSSDPSYDPDFDD
ncbi:MAG TPA: hypothetical protein PKC24_00760 [Cyclobacteriaceae bacterium]|nr:hypothetical protein [Cyclobacteriaceae bacterium]